MKIVTCIYFSILFVHMMYFSIQVQFHIFHFPSYFQTKASQGSLEVQNFVFYINIKAIFELMELFKLLLPIAITVILQLIILPDYFRISGFHNNIRFCHT